MPDVAGERPAAAGTPPIAASAPAGFENWLFQPVRLRRFGAALLLAYAAILLLHILPRDWPLRPDGHPRYIDFVSFWVHGRFALTSAAARAYDYAAFSAAQIPLVAATKGDFPYYRLVYPPTMFPLVAPLGLFPYVVAMAVWLGATGLLYLAAARRIVAHPLAPLLALLPAAAIKNIWLGQTGFLVAGLLGFSLLLMRTRPFAAGLCLGLLTCKPQYGLIFPIVLLAAGQGRVIAGACVSAAALGAIATLAYGPAIWDGYLQTLRGSNLNNFMTEADLEAIDQTVFGAAHWLGLGFAAKWTVHALAVAAVTITVCAIWRRPVSANLRAAALGAGALLATPYMLAYDLTALTIPAAFLVREGMAAGFRRGERTVLLLCFLALFLMQAVPVGPFILVALLVMVWRRAVPSEAGGPEGLGVA